MHAYAAAVTVAVCFRLPTFMHSCVPRERTTRQGACVVVFAVLEGLTEGYASVWVGACVSVQAHEDESTSLRWRFEAGVRASNFGERRSIRFVNVCYGEASGFRVY